MKVSCEDLSPVKRSVSVEVPFSVVEKSLNKVYEKLQKEIKVPGFRPGKVPLQLIKKRVGDDIGADVAEQVVRDTFPKVAVDNNLAPLSEPQFEPGEYKEGKPFSYKVVFEVYPKVEALGYEGLKLEKEKVEVTDEEVTRELDILRSRMAELASVEDAVIDEGMVALVDFTGNVEGGDGSKLEGKDSMLDFSDGNLIPAFAKQVKGMKVGEAREVTIDYPKDYYDKNLAAKSGTLTVTVKDIKKKNVPELNADFAKSLGSFEDVESLKKDMKERIASVKENVQKESLTRQILEQLIAKFKLEIPEVLVREELSNIFAAFVKRLASEGKKFENSGIKIEDFVLKHEADARQRVASYMILKAVAEKENVTVDDNSIEEHFSKISKETNQPVQKIKAHYNKDEEMANLRWQLQAEKTLDLILSQAKIKEVKPSKEKHKTKEKGKK
ncbi:MAG: trigger factor [Pseudomonadota bacterium]